MPSDDPSESSAAPSSLASEDSSSIANDSRIHSAAIQRYQSQLDQIAGTADVLAARDSRLGTLRIALFLGAVVLWVVGYASSGLMAAAWIGWLLFAGFLVTVAINESVRESLEETQRHRSVIERLIARLRRDWDSLATKNLTHRLSTIQLAGHRREVAGDLDLLGRASLFHLVSMAATTPGIRTMADWLSGPAVATIARQREAAACALAPLRDERLRFYTLARDVGESTGDPEQFVAWATGDAWLEKRGWLSAWAAITSAASLIMIVGLGVALVAGSATLLKVCLAVLAVVLVVNLLITTAVLGPAHGIFAIAMANRRSVDDYHEIFMAAKDLPQAKETNPGNPSSDDPDDQSSDDPDDLLGRIRSSLVDGPRSAVSGMNALRRVAVAGSLRQSAGTFLIYLPLQMFGLWDVWVLRRLESWQAKYRGDVTEWFGGLGELECLMSIAALRDDYPEWATPKWNAAGQPATLKATSIGHPLLRDEDRVSNDVQVGPPGTLLLVTGSNMSGKSTMLRSIGLNVALAGVGAPVCASDFEVPSVELATSIRVSDDVSQGVSFYMAELKRLKSVVDQAREMARVNDRVCLFLLDEILQGTNSRERQIAVVQVLRHLMQSQSIGAITTHDLELADEPELLSIATTVHFRETIRPDAEGNEQMTFDYQMQQGVSPTTNALRLLEMVGLGRDS